MKILIAITLSAFALNGFSQLKVDGEFRPKTEFRQGYKKLPTQSNTPALIVSQRSRINLSFTQSKIKYKFSVQDVRLWGDEKYKSDSPGISLHEAWIKLPIKKNANLKIGRQVIKYDNQRLLSASNWNQSGAKHDAINLQYLKNNFEIDFVTAFNQHTANLSGTDYSALPSNYKTLNILWIKKKVKNLTLSSLTIADGYQKVTTSNTLYVRLTSGINFIYQKGNLSIESRYYLQKGRNAIGQQLNGFYLNGLAEYKLSKKIKCTIGKEIISGRNTNESANLFSAFDILYGKKHSTNGIIDYYSTPTTTKNAGLDDSYLSIQMTPNKKNAVSISYHFFRLHRDYLNNNQPINKNIGSEIDLLFTNKLNDHIKLNIGYALYFGTESTEIIRGGDSSLPGKFAYIMLTAKPTIFTHD